MPRRLADLERRISRGYGIPAAEARRLLTSSVFTIRLDDLSDVEASDIFANRPVAGITAVTSAAAELAHVGIFNPVGSGVLTLVSLIFANSDAAQSLDIRTTSVPLTGSAVFGEFTDRRLTGAGASEIRNQSAAVAIGVLAIRVRVLASTTLPIPVLFVLPEGRGINVVETAAQQTLTATFIYTEEDA